MLIIFVCNRMRWTYQEYLAQPTGFILSLVNFWAIMDKQ